MAERTPRQVYEALAAGLERVHYELRNVEGNASLLLAKAEEIQANSSVSATADHDKLANWILQNIPQEIGRETSESAAEVAIRVMDSYIGLLKTIQQWRLVREYLKQAKEDYSAIAYGGKRGDLLSAHERLDTRKQQESESEERFWTLANAIPATAPADGTQRAVTPDFTSLQEGPKLEEPEYQQGRRRRIVLSWDDEDEGRFHITGKEEIKVGKIEGLCGKTFGTLAGRKIDADEALNDPKICSNCARTYRRARARSKLEGMGL